jgi:hypothetical protein
MLENEGMKLCDMHMIWHLLGEKQDCQILCGSDSPLLQRSKLLQPIDELLATEGEDDTLIHEPTGLCVTCAASGTLTHTAVVKKMHAKVNGPGITTKHHHACDVSKKQKIHTGFPQDQSDVAISLVGPVPRLIVIKRGLTSATNVKHA